MTNQNQSSSLEKSINLVTSDNYVNDLPENLESELIIDDFLEDNDPMLDYIDNDQDKSEKRSFFSSINNNKNHVPKHDDFKKESIPETIIVSYTYNHQIQHLSESENKDKIDDSKENISDKEDSPEPLEVILPIFQTSSKTSDLDQFLDDDDIFLSNIAKEIVDYNDALNKNNIDSSQEGQTLNIGKENFNKTTENVEKEAETLKKDKGEFNEDNENANQNKENLHNNSDTINKVKETPNKAKEKGMTEMKIIRCFKTGNTIFFEIECKGNENELTILPEDLVKKHFPDTLLDYYEQFLRFQE